MAADRLDVAAAWPQPFPVAEAARGPAHRSLVADEAARGRIAKLLGLDGLASLEALLKVSPWLDGVQVEGAWRARVGQTCGVTLEPFESDLEGRIMVRAVPPGSPALGSGEPELDLDPDADDPPDLLEGDAVDLGAYVVEDLSLAVDPFPRKPGVAFEAPAGGAEPSPFAVLAKLKGGEPDA